jgi:hypothetical protein
MARYKNKLNRPLPLDLPGGDAISLPPHGEFPVDRQLELSSRFRALKAKGHVEEVNVDLDPSEDPIPTPPVSVPLPPPKPSPIPEPVTEPELDPKEDLASVSSSAHSDDPGQHVTDSGAVSSDAQDTEDPSSGEPEEPSSSDGESEPPPGETRAPKSRSKRKKRGRRGE